MNPNDTELVRMKAQMQFLRGRIIREAGQGIMRRSGGDAPHDLDRRIDHIAAALDSEIAQIGNTAVAKALELERKRAAVECPLLARIETLICENPQFSLRVDYGVPVSNPNEPPLFYCSLHPDIAPSTAETLTDVLKEAVHEAQMIVENAKAVTHADS